MTNLLYDNTNYSIKPLDDKFFTINGLKKPKIFYVDKLNNKSLILKNINNDGVYLKIKLKSLNIEGKLYTNINEAVNDLSEIVFKKGGGIGNGGTTKSEKLNFSQYKQFVEKESINITTNNQINGKVITYNLSEGKVITLHYLYDNDFNITGFEFKGDIDANLIDEKNLIYVI